MRKDIFRYQLWHIISLTVLVFFSWLFVSVNNDALNGQLWNIGTRGWFWLALAVPAAHQFYVWIIWRLELYGSTFSSRYGLNKAFRLYSLGFSILFLSRLVTIIFLSVSNRRTLSMNPFYSYLIAALIIPIGIYLFYSVIRYFTMERAYGIDHFDKNYNKPYVKNGIFRYTGNAMYIYGFLILYIPGLLFFSKAALAAAVFNHLYIWVHFYCTERPDMKVIYGKLQ